MNSEYCSSEKPIETHSSIWLYCLGAVYCFSSNTEGLFFSFVELRATKLAVRWLSNASKWCKHPATSMSLLAIQPVPSGLGVRPICFRTVPAFGTLLQEKHPAGWAWWRREVLAWARCHRTWLQPPGTAPWAPSPGAAPTPGVGALPSAALGKQGRALGDALAAGEVEPPGFLVCQNLLGKQLGSESALGKDAPLP